MFLPILLYSHCFSLKHSHPSLQDNLKPHRIQGHTASTPLEFFIFIFSIACWNHRISAKPCMLNNKRGVTNMKYEIHKPVFRRPLLLLPLTKETECFPGAFVNRITDEPLHQIVMAYFVDYCYVQAAMTETNLLVIISQQCNGCFMVHATLFKWIAQIKKTDSLRSRREVI